MASAVEAFDRAAEDYDRDFGRNPVGLLFRHAFQEALRRHLAAGDRVLDLGCGTGDDALFLAGLGMSVLGIDPSPAMIARARAKAAERGADRVRFEVKRAEDVADLPATYDAAYSNFGALNCADLERVGTGLGRTLRPGGPVMLCLFGRRPLPAMLERGLTGRGEARPRSHPRVGGIAVAVSYPTRGQVVSLLGPAFEWRKAWALGVVVPGPGHADWAYRHPQAFGVLAAVESLLRAWPLLRDLGDHLVLEGRRR
jgi:SAM-dependent methyltransferase